MRMGWVVTLVLVIAMIMLSVAAGQAHAQEAQEKRTEDCSLPKGRTSAAEDLPRILAEHREWVAKWRDNKFSEQWAEDHPEGRANLCKADLSRAELNDADLRGAELNKADLIGAELNKADLHWANLNKADLHWANLNDANLTGANLTETRLAFANLTGAIYAPASPPPNPYLEGIKGLSTVVFPEGSGSGLVQLRELLQKAGLRDLEREATFAIERGKTWHTLNLLSRWANDNQENDNVSDPSKPLEDIDGFDLVGLGKAILDHPWVVESILSHRGEVGEGVFRLVAFDWTTAYGLYPTCALAIIFWSGVLLIPVYAWAIFRMPHWHDSPGIYRIWSKERIEASAGRVRLSDATDVERLSERDWRAVTWAHIIAHAIDWRRRDKQMRGEEGY
jgi:hypothetical protein